MLSLVEGRQRNWSGSGEPFRASTILVVDDEPDGRDLLRVLLQSQGHIVVCADGAAAAIDVIAQGSVDLVLLDLMMSKMDGVELCTYIRRTLGREHLPLVFVTSLHDRASRIRAKEAGADDFLVKPVDGLELLVRIESLLRTGARVERSLRERNLLMRELARVRGGLFGAVGAEGMCAGTEHPSVTDVARQQRSDLEELQAMAGLPDAAATLVRHALEVARSLEQRLGELSPQMAGRDGDDQSSCTRAADVGAASQGLLVLRMLDE